MKLPRKTKVVLEYKDGRKIEKKFWNENDVVQFIFKEYQKGLLMEDFYTEPEKEGWTF